MTIDHHPARDHSLHRRSGNRGLLGPIWADTWRFALAGPPVGTALLVLPMLAASALDMPVSLDEVIGSWLFFSIFAYFFAGSSAAMAGALYGWMKYHSGHRSRWGIGALAGTLGWLLQVAAIALWTPDVENLQAVVFTPIALASGALCGRLFEPASSAAKDSTVPR